jgi:hypothetical protein
VGLANPSDFESWYKAGSDHHAAHLPRMQQVGLAVDALPICPGYMRVPKSRSETGSEKRVRLRRFRKSCLRICEPLDERCDCGTDRRKAEKSYCRGWGTTHSRTIGAMAKSGIAGPSTKRTANDPKNASRTRR